jgi:HAD superfamily hydrolase (TIGR01450 family)
MLISSPSPLAEAYDLALVDLDGVVYLGPEPVPHAADGLRQARAAGMDIVFVTNNASREPGTVAAQLRDLGVAAEPAEVLTSAQTAVALLGDVVGLGATVLVVGGEGLVTAVREAGFRMVASADDDPDAVIQGFGPQVSWGDLAEASYAVHRGARYVVTNRDLTQPKERGIAPGNGTLVAAVVTTTGVEPISAGKPEPAMFQHAARTRGARRPLVIGDRLDTDLGGAHAAGFDGLLVLTGVCSARDAVLAPVGQRPHYLGADLRSLLEPHPAPERDGEGWWVCRQAAARVRDGVLEISGDPVDTLDRARAACAAAWDADGSAAERLDTSRLPEL